MSHVAGATRHPIYLEPAMNANPRLATVLRFLVRKDYDTGRFWLIRDGQRVRDFELKREAIAAMRAAISAA